MRVIRHVVLTLMLAVVYAAPAPAQFENVGTVNFPTSGTPDAQRHFLRGVAILHSFGWVQAIEQFQLAQEAQPDFAMAYWGETLCYNHPLFAQQDVTQPREVLARLGATPQERLAKAPTDREKGFLRAVEALWGEGDDRARRVAYMEQMGALYDRYPDDHEVAAFYALSMLMAGQATDDRSLRLEMQAGAVAMRVLAENPSHPGAVHYTIHAFDDPLHAPLALSAAEKFAQIAPAVSHARHMPSHIFIQRGMWDHVAASNLSAYEAARDLWQPGDSVGDMMHALDWGQYGYLQRGDYTGARQWIETIEQVLEESGQQRARSAYVLARARYVIETEEWAVEPVTNDLSPEALLATGLSAAKTGDLATAEQAAAKLNTVAEERGWTAAPAGRTAENGSAMPSDSAKAAIVMHHEITALIELARGDTDRAVARLEMATGIEESTRPPRGPAVPPKPSHELAGEVLLEIGRPADAAARFETTLQRMPNRPRSLLGAARAYAQLGDHARAAAHYRKLAEIWQGRTALAGYQEARRFLDAQSSNR